MGWDADGITPRNAHYTQVERGFYAAGLLAAHCLLYGKTLSVNFNACFLKLVLQRKLTLSDLQVWLLLIRANSLETCMHTCIETPSSSMPCSCLHLHMHARASMPTQTLPSIHTQDLDPDFHRHLESMLQLPGAEHICLSFTQPALPGAEVHKAGEVELCPGGADKAVTDANKVCG